VLVSYINLTVRLLPKAAAVCLSNSVHGITCKCDADGEERQEEERPPTVYRFQEPGELRVKGELNPRIVEAVKLVCMEKSTFLV
jgi:hypothetical protein